MTEIPAELSTLLPHESPEEYRAHVEGMIASHQPENAFEKWLVEEFAAAAWNYRRARSVEASFWENIGGSYNRGPAGVAEAMFQEKEARFRCYLRYRAQAAREYQKALAAVERMRADRDRRGGLSLKTRKAERERQDDAAGRSLAHAAAMSAGGNARASAAAIGAAQDHSPKPELRGGRGDSAPVPAVVQVLHPQSGHAAVPISGRESLKPSVGADHLSKRSRAQGAARTKNVTGG